MTYTAQEEICLYLELRHLHKRIRQYKLECRYPPEHLRIHRPMWRQAIRDWTRRVHEIRKILGHN